MSPPLLIGIAFRLFGVSHPTVSALALSYPEHLSPAYRADALSRWLSILHGYRLGILHFSLGSTFHTVCLHWSTPFLLRSISYSFLRCQ